MFMNGMEVGVLDNRLTLYVAIYSLGLKVKRHIFVAYRYENIEICGRIF